MRRDHTLPLRRPRRRTRHAVGALAALALSGATAAGQVRVPLPGDPLPGLTPAEFEEFRIGLDDFLEVETADEGLGPAYNGTSCGACHSVPAVGGTGSVAEVRAARRGPAGEFVPLDPSGESLFQLFSVPGHACQPAIPPDATVVARRVPIPLFGAGLVEAILDETILALEDPVDRDRDGVSGRATIVIDVATGAPRVGRFGWKAQHATLITFGADAYRNEMGITNDLFPLELALGVPPERMRVCDRIPDPEDVRDPRTGGAVSTTSPASCGTSRRSAGASSTTPSGPANTCSPRPAAPRVTCRSSRRDPARAQPCTDDRCRFSPTYSYTTSARVMASAREPPRPGRSGRRPCGGSASAVRCSTTARR